MSYKGVVEAHCPTGCEPFEAEAWSLIRGDREPDLREAVEVGELNLLICPTCGRVFYYEHPFIYHDPGRELLAFVYPGPYLAEEARWRTQMAEDYRAFSAASPGGVKLPYAPILLFGIEALQQNLLFDAERLEEDEVAEALALELGLGSFAVRPEYAREHDMPERLPLGKGGSMRERVSAGVKRLVAENDRLERYAHYLTKLQAPGAVWEDPPAARAKAAEPKPKREVQSEPREEPEASEEHDAW